MGAVANRAGELFAGIVAEVPFVDVLNTMLDDTLPLTPPEWPEWGNPIESEKDFRTILSYSPYDNVAAKDYPAILAMGGLTDPRVTYWEPAKWIARLRATMTRRRPGAAAHQHGRRPRRRLGPLRPARRSRDRLCVRAVGGGMAEGGVPATCRWLPPPQSRKVMSVRTVSTAMPNYTKNGLSRRITSAAFSSPGRSCSSVPRTRATTNIMTMGWHMIMEFEPSLVGCYIWTENHSFEMIRRSKQCVINLPTEDLARQGGEDRQHVPGATSTNSPSSALPPKPGTHVRAPLIGECYANFECKLVDLSKPDPGNTACSCSKTMHRGNGDS